ncbi:hypothetical protein DB30_06861 [Enhygromyxa salina]|uniref:Alginate export domain-containing protein n=1 Tax=Enhygromyxa salina TaxID=215803 RepID=A0A0C2CT93_9BACT|nr:hypothetical protein [Enhygromyxa salina]KIG14386.1 hypothetical protein DB30_06861 [Enhygromyxa salina]
MFGLALSLLLALGPQSAPEDGVRFAPPPIEHGFDLRENWDDLWRRFEDRHGRPDPRGPLLQPAPELQRPEYELTLAVAEAPLYLQRDWNRRTRGAQMFLHSDDEFTFFNQVRLKEQTPIGPIGAFGIRYDRRELREVQSSLVQLSFAFPDIRGTGLFVEIRPIARLEKPDLDVDFAVGWARPSLGSVRTRVFVLDPFNNASDALAQNRANTQDLRVVQRNPSIGLSAEAEVFVLPSLRAQAFFGGLLPSRSSYYYSTLLEDEQGKFDVEREQSALLGGGWLEWAARRAPVRVGVSATSVRTHQHDFDAGGARLRRLPERETRARAYLLLHLDAETVGRFLGQLDLEFAGSTRLTELPAHVSEFGAVPRDQSWLGMVRAQWLPTRTFGLELGYFVLDRQAEGDSELSAYLSETNHRLSTRFSLAFDPYVRLTFGVGWDLDDASNRYDQGGMTLIARW